MTIQKKCPNCGSLVPSFSLKCDKCDYVFSSESESSAVAREAIERLQIMLKDIDQNSTNLSKKSIAKAKSTIITTFVVPNTKEAMINFLILDFSNIESSSETQDMAITRASEARAISTYNLLKLQQDADSQIETVLKEYSVLEDKKGLAKIDGRAKQRSKHIKIVCCTLIALIILSIPFINNIVEKINYDPILVAIEEGRYEEAVEKINNDGTLKHSVEFYIDKLVASPIMVNYSQRDYNPTTGLVTTKTTYFDGTNETTWDFNNICKNYEVWSYDTLGNLDYHMKDTLRLDEKLWSISSSASRSPIKLPYSDKNCIIKYDSFGRITQISGTYKDGTHHDVYYKYNEQDIVTHQVSYQDGDTIIIDSVVRNDGNTYVFMDYVSKNGSSPELNCMRILDNRYRVIEYVKYFCLLGNTYTIRHAKFTETDRLHISKEKSIPSDQLLKFNFSAELETSVIQLRDPKSGKGVVLDFSLLEKNSSETTSSK